MVCRSRPRCRLAQPNAAKPAGKAPVMVRNFDDMQKMGTDTVDATLKSLNAFSKSAQAIASEIADYSKKVFEDGAAASEKLIGAKSLDAILDVQRSYLKGAYESFVAESVKVGELYTDLAQQTFKPFANGLYATTAK